MSEDREAEERDRGILSKADRAYLRDEKDLSEQGERDTRYRIRNRIKNGIFDFGLVGVIDEKDRNMIFEEIGPRSAIPVLAFFLNGLVDLSDSINEGKELFEAILENTVLGVFTNRDEDYIIEDVSVDITVDKRKPDLDALVRKYREDEASMDELQYIMASDEFEGDEELLSNRLFKRVYENTGISDEVKQAILSDTDFDNIEKYFDHIDNLIRQEAENTD